MLNIELPSPGSLEASNEGVGQQALDDATYEPHDYVEQVGDYRQAEAIQASFEAVLQPGQAPEHQVMLADVDVPRTAETQEQYIEGSNLKEPLNTSEDKPEEDLQTMEALAPQVTDGSQV